MSPSKKHILMILSFILTSFITVGMVGQLKWERVYGMEVLGPDSDEDTTQESYLSHVYYYKLENSIPALELYAYELVMQPTRERTSFFSPKGTAYTKDQGHVDYTAQRGVHHENRNELHLWEDVKLESETHLAQASEMSYKINSDELWAKGDVSTESLYGDGPDYVYVEARQMKGRPLGGWAQYTGDVKGKIERQKAYEPPLHFSSDKLNVDLEEDIIEMLGNVSIEKQDLTATSLRGEIFLENYNKKLKYYALYDDVKVVERIRLGGIIQERKAFAEKLEGLMSENLVVLTGYPKVFQGQDVIKGNRIVLRENNEVVEVEDANTNFILGE
jgi:lipopolysaccharide export system protein LptA